jgi:hypothetical protein
LRKDHGVSLQHLRLVAEELGHLNEDLWSQTTLYVLNKEVYFDEPKTGKTRGIVSGQYTAIPLARVAKEVSSEIAKLGKRTKGQIGDVERHRHVARNSWVLAGTRIPTKTIKRFFDAGYSKAQIMKEYPVLTRKDIDAALNHEQKPAKSA